MIPALIGAVGGLIGTGIAGMYASNNASRNIAMNERLTRRQMDFADRQATIAYERQQALMDKNNAYNDPTAQMARLKQAGLNPYLAYDKGNATIQASSASVQQAATPSAVAVPDYYANGTNILASGINTAFQNFAQLVKLKNETKLAEAQAANLKASTGNTSVQTELARKSMPLQLNALELQNDAIKAGLEKTKVDKILSEAQAALAKTQNKHEEAKIKVTAQQAVFQEVLNKYVDKRQAAELAKLLVDAKLAASQNDNVRMATSLQQFEAATARISANASMTNAKKESLEQFLIKQVNSIFSSFMGDNNKSTFSDLLIAPLKVVTEFDKLFRKKK